MQAEQDNYKVLGITPSANTKEMNEAYAILSDPSKRKQYDIPLGFNAIAPKFKADSKVRINSHSFSPYRDHIGIVDQKPVKDAFRFWYMVRFESKNFSTINRFAEEELSKIGEQRLKHLHEYVTY